MISYNRGEQKGTRVLNHSHIEYFIPRNMFHEIFHVRIYDIRLGIWVSRKTCGGPSQPSSKQKDFGSETTGH